MIPMPFPAIDMVEGRTVNLTGEDAVGPVVPLGQAWLSMSDTIWWSSVLPAGVLRSLHASLCVPQSSVSSVAFFVPLQTSSPSVNFPLLRAAH